MLMRTNHYYFDDIATTPFRYSCIFYLLLSLLIIPQRHQSYYKYDLLYFII